MDISNPTYKGSDVDLTFPSPGCGGGPWDSVPPGHKAQAVDLALAKPVLDKLGLPDTVEGACLETQGSAVPEVWSEDFPPSPSDTGYECLFGAAYVGSHLGRGAIWRAAQADAEVEGWRYKVRATVWQTCKPSVLTLRLPWPQVALAAALRYEP